jgi:hypothetical protein
MGVSMARVIVNWWRQWNTHFVRLYIFGCADLQVPGPAVNDSVEAPGEVVEVEREGLCNRSTQGGCRGWGKSHVLDGMVDVEVVCQGIDKGDGVSGTRVAK